MYTLCTSTRLMRLTADSKTSEQHQQQQSCNSERELYACECEQRSPRHMRTDQKAWHGEYQDGAVHADADVWRYSEHPDSIPLRRTLSRRPNGQRSKPRVSAPRLFFTAPTCSVFARTVPSCRACRECRRAASRTHRPGRTRWVTQLGSPSHEAAYSMS